MERYTRVRKVGSGSFGEVFEGLDNETGEVVAIKVMRFLVPKHDPILNLNLTFLHTPALSSPPWEDISEPQPSQVFDLDDPRQDLESMQREASILARCSHPNVARYFSSFCVSTELWIVMEYASGGSISDHLDAGLTEAQIAAILRGMVTGWASIPPRKTEQEHT